MDASAYLQKQGWRGTGHSLDHTDRGIKKPLLVSKKVDVLGVGLNKHTAVSDQWWLRAFDAGLKNFGTGQDSALSQVQKHGVNRGGLYARFTKGEGVPGSIGESPVAGPNVNTGTNTHAEAQPETQDAMAIDIPPADKLERTVGKFDDQNHHDAMMHLLQNPDAAPPGMQKMLDKKRKRAERPVEKRARRKTERSEQSKENARENKRKAIEEGTWDREQEEQRREEKTLNKQAKEYVTEAQQRGIIPVGPNEIRKGLVPTGANAEQQGAPSEAFVTIISRAGLDPHTAFVSAGKQSEKAQKYTREKMKREVKRAAKAYATGEKPRSEQTVEERRAKKAEKKERTAEKKAVAAQKEAEKMASREQKTEKKRQTRATKKAEKEAVKEKMADTQATNTTNGAVTTNGDVHMLHASEFNTGADEVRFGINSQGGLKIIPGVGAVDRYPTKAEKKAKKLMALAIKEGVTEDDIKQRVADEQAKKTADEKLKVDQYRAMKHGMSFEEYRKALAEGKVHTPKVEKKNLPAEKLADYAKRAQQKGITVDEYIQRREEKYAAKQAEKLGNPFQSDMMDAVNEGEDAVVYKPATQSSAAPGPNDNGLGFVVDTAGDDALAVKPTGSKTTGADGIPLAMVDTEGDATHSAAQTGMPIPLDPRVWEGIKPKDMPKAMRKARQQWMKARREERKARVLADKPAQPPKKSKGQRKVEARENFVKQILFHSRKVLLSGSSFDDKDFSVTIEGVEGVPLVKVQSREGIFKKEEVALARTVARRVLRNVKRDEKAKKGMGKGFKKRERSAKEAARMNGISGFTDRARLDPGYKGSGQRALMA